MVAEVENAGFFNFITYFTVCKGWLAFLVLTDVPDVLCSILVHKKNRFGAKNLQSTFNKIATGEFQAVGCSKTRQR